MVHIILDDDQVRLVTQATEVVEIRDRHGRGLGYVAHRFTDEDLRIADARLHGDERRYTTREVLDHIRSLEPQ